MSPDVSGYYWSVPKYAEHAHILSCLGAFFTTPAFATANATHAFTDNTQTSSTFMEHATQSIQVHSDQESIPVKAPSSYSSLESTALKAVQRSDDRQQGHNR